MCIKFKSLNKTIIKCKKCPRLVKFIKKISTEKRKQNIKETYWGKPVTGFGDYNAKILILGLAPAAHGGTRTGRAFTGDKSGEFLFKCLHKAKIANQSLSENLVMELKKNGLENCKIEGKESKDWKLVDANDIIIHIFHPEKRDFYDLEKMWSEEIPKEKAMI